MKMQYLKFTYGIRKLTMYFNNWDGAELLYGEQVGAEIDLPAPQANFFPDVVPVNFDRSGRYMKQFGDFLCCSSFFYKIYDLDFHRREIGVFRE